MSPFALVLEAAAPAPAPAPPQAALGDRLRCCARYVNVVAEQLTALRQHDAERVMALTEERRRLEAELGIPESGEQSPTTAPHWLLTALLDAGLTEMSREVEQDQRAREYWAALDDEARVAARGISARRLGRYAALAPADARLDVRF